MLDSKRCGFVLAIALLCVGPAEAAAQGGGGGREPMTPLAYRQDLMGQMRSTMAALTAIHAGEAGAPEHVLPRAVILEQLGTMLGGAVPEGAAPEGSRALPAIWASPADYARSVEEFQGATRALEEVARAGDAEGLAAAQTTVQRACASCHMQFRGPPVR